MKELMSMVTKLESKDVLKDRINKNVAELKKSMAKKEEAKK